MVFRWMRARARRRSMWVAAVVMSLGAGCDGASSGDDMMPPEDMDARAPDEGTSVPGDGMVGADEDAGGADAGGADAGGADADGGDADEGMSERVVVQNHDLEACRGDTVTRAVLPDERGHWTGERLVPPSTPFRVDEIEYWLRGALPNVMSCAVDVPHRVFVVSAPDGAPPAAPSAVASYRELDVQLPPGQLVASRIALDPPLVVGAGEAVFVGVEVGVGADPPGSQLCVNVCPRTRTPAVSFWSNAAGEPFPWQDLAVEYDLPNNNIRVYGAPVE
ncbi:MAG: hypothetical protein H6703_04715 [Myxococcales bacterium]|nr:hypothetical protein [Myxococcales bacterium]